VNAFLEDMIQCNRSYQVPEGNMYDIREVSLDELLIPPIFTPYETENKSLLTSKC